MKIHYLVALTFLIVLGSCSNEQNQLVPKIDKLSITLDSIEKVLLNNEIDTLAALKVATNAVELRIKNYYFLDSIDYEFGKKMDSYKVMRRSLGPLGKNFSEIKNGIAEERATLENLKDDILNNKGKKEEYESSFNFEKEKVEQLRILLKSYILEKDKTMKTFTTLHNELNSFSLELLEKYKKGKSTKK